MQTQMSNLSATKKTDFSRNSVIKKAAFADFILKFGFQFGLALRRRIPKYGIARGQ